MFVAMPDGKGCPPLFEPGTEIFRAVDRVQHRSPLCGKVAAMLPAFLANEHKSIQPRLKILMNCLFEIDVGAGYWTTISLPGNIITPLLNHWQFLKDKVRDFREKSTHILHVRVYLQSLNTFQSLKAFRRMGAAPFVCQRELRTLF